MARALGARAQMALAFETTYGTPPASGFTKMPFASTTLGAEQPLLNSELLGYGRDPLEPIKDAVTADGDVVMPIDAAGFGFWLKAAFGTPATTGTGPWTHEFQPGSWTLPSLSIETGMPEVPRYALYSGCVLDQPRFPSLWKMSSSRSWTNALTLDFLALWLFRMAKIVGILRKPCKVSDVRHCRSLRMRKQCSNSPKRSFTNYPAIPSLPMAATGQPGC